MELLFTVTNYVGESHWLCIAITKSKQRLKVKVMDSLGLLLDLNHHTILQISQIVKTKKLFLDIEKVTVQQQTGSTDCGLFAIAYAVEACLENNKLEDAKFEQTKMRDHLITCLEKEILTQFPKASTISIQCPGELLKMKVYCLCRMPEFFDFEMIQCDGCSKWYHKRCVVMKNLCYWTCENCM